MKKSTGPPDKLIIFMEEKNYHQNYSPPLVGQSQLEDLLKENLRYNRAIFADLQKVKRHMRWRTIFNIVWLILILAPLLLAIFWLPEIIADFLKQFQELTGDSQGTLDLLKQLKQLR